jgi:hypothetical protein
MFFMAAKPDRDRAARDDFSKSCSRAFDSRWPKVSRVLGKIGPGIVTGAADDDPSGIATYSQAGARFGFTMLWTLIFSYPLMAGIQEISASIGRVTGRGIAANIRRHYSVWVLYPLVALLLAANVINLGADIGAMGVALKLLVGGPGHLYSVGFGIASDRRDINSISPVCTDFQMVSAGAAGVYSGSVCIPRAMVGRAGGDVHSERLVIGELYVRPDGSVWDHD